MQVFGIYRPSIRAAFGALILLATALVLSACQSAPPQSAAPSFLSEYGISEITVSFADVDEPLREGVLEADIKRGLSTGNALQNMGTQLGINNRGEVRQQLESAITANIVPHVRDAMASVFTGSKPARAIVMIKSVFIRKAGNLQELTGTRVTVNGQRLPDNPQFIANLVVYDQASGLPMVESGTITRIDDGTVVIAGGGPKAPEYGNSKRLNRLVFEFTQEAAKRIRKDAEDDGSNWTGSGF